MSENKIDIQCGKIAKGIKQLLHLMDTSLIEHALELHSSSKSSENFALLKRFRKKPRSIYKERQEFILHWIPWALFCRKKRNN